MIIYQHMLNTPPGNKSMSTPIATSTAQIVEMKPLENYSIGDDVFLTEEYYEDTKATLLEVPRYGWQVKVLVDGVATIEYMRANWKLLMQIMCETTYLKREA